MDSSVGNFDEDDWLQALGLTSDEKIERSIASPRLEPARQRQRLDGAGAGRPAPRDLEADLVAAAEAEPDARPEDMEPTLPSTEDGEDAAADADDLAPADEFKKVYNKFLTNYRRWVTSQTAVLQGRQLARAKARFQLHGKSSAEKEKLAEAFWAARGGNLPEREQILAHWLNKEGGVQRRLWLHSK